MKRKLRIDMIGSGNVATHLAQALVRSGHELVGIYSRTRSHAEELACRVGTLSACSQQPKATDALEQLPSAEVYIFSVKDSVLAELAAQLAVVLPEGILRSSLFLHTAGCMSVDVLTPHFAQCAVVYPLQTFSKQAELDFSSVPLFVEGNHAEADERAMQLACSLSKQVRRLDGEGRKRIHLAGVLANNFTNHFCALAYEWLESSGIAPQCLLPIIDETARKLHTTLPRDAQTGPARRWDTNVMERHEAMLAERPELQRLYEEISQSIHHYYTKQQ